MLAAGVLLAGSVSALPASAEGIFAAGSGTGISYSFGDITEEKPELDENYRSTAKYVKISWKKVAGASGYLV